MSAPSVTHLDEKPITDRSLPGAPPSHPTSGNVASALRLANAGLRIFPCSDDKRPLGGIRWRDESTSDAAKIAAWWRRWPDALVGIDAGKSGLVVIDADRHAWAADGVAALQKVVGAPLQSLGCPVVETAGNGVHLYFRAPEGETFGNSAGSLPAGVDVRGMGGYVIGPGSTRADGSSWATWHGSLGLAEAFQAGKIPPLPERISTLIRTRRADNAMPKLAEAPQPTAPLRDAGRRERAFAMAALERNAAELAATGDGGRNVALNSIAYRMGRMSIVGWIDAPAIRAALLAACETNGLIATDGQRAFDASFRSGMSAGGKDPHPALVDHRFANDDAELQALGDQIAQNLGASAKVATVATVAGVAEAPRPLFRALPQASPYPVDALGSILAPAARAIIDRIQCPDALAAQSVLAAASLAVQAHADVEIPATGHVRPISIFVISVAASGERKSAADGEALWSVRKREKALRETYVAEVPEYLKLKTAWDAARKKALDGGKDDKHATKAKLDAVGDEPPKPLEPMLTCGEPTFEGLCKLLASGQPAMGIFSDEGGSFIGGHGMSPDAKLRTVAGLSGVWDGVPIKRVRALDGSSIIAGKRVAVHLMAQPEAAAHMLTDPVLLDQGFLSRLLVSAPASTAGTRMQRTPDIASGVALSRYHARILSILERQPTMALDMRNELDPRVLRFTPDAAQAWREYADHVERLLAPGQPLDTIRGFANKLPEHAARIAAVLTLIENIEAMRIDREAFERAVHLAEYYTREALRLFGAGYASPELQRAAKLLDWLKTSWGEPLISVRAIVRLGPNSIRDTATAKAAIKALVEHGWLAPHVGGAVVEGQSVREAWKTIREGGK